ncbi:MAG: hypothetical protein IJT62_04355 [Oscillospiraceae bacterium]|nr:hypothetical protein [Oscillospiraceae bacterium]
MPAFPNYGYQPFQPYYPTFQTPAAQPVQQTPPPVQPPASIIWVGSSTEATMYPVAPNAAVTLWNQNEPVVYLKQADASGRPTMKVYDLVERQEAAQGVSSPGGKLPDYATKAELTALNSALDKLKGDLETMRGEISNKRRPARRQEEDYE